MQTLIQVEPRKVFGRIDYMPVNDLAEKFCYILNKPNLPLDAIIKLKALGYTVDEVLKPTI